MSAICHIVGAADFAAERFRPSEGDLVIACDAGLLALRGIECEPDLILGDFDSLGYAPVGNNVITHPVRKDHTDSQLAVVEGIERGYREFILHGCTGGKRADHTVANLQTLAFARSRGARAWLFAPGYTAAVISGEELRFSGKEEGWLSVFAFGGEVFGLCESGLEYEARGARLPTDDPYGVSNSFRKGESASVSCERGDLLVMWQSTGTSLPEVIKL